MDSEWETHRLRHEKNMWRAIAIGLAVVLVLLTALGGMGVLFLAARSQQAAVRAEIAMVEERQQRLQAEQANAEPITKERAIAIAEEHLKVKGRREAKARAQENGGWRVTIWRLPAMPGGFTVVIIDEQGRVVRVEGGE
jgi:hypothetical protein